MCEPVSATAAVAALAASAAPAAVAGTTMGLAALPAMGTVMGVGGAVGTAAAGTAAAGAGAAAGGAAAAGMSLGTKLAIGSLAMGAATGGASFYQSQQAADAQAANAEDMANAENAAAEVNMRQVGAQTAQQKKINAGKAHQIRSMLRARAGESGLGMGGSTAALMRQVDFDAASNADVLDTNRSNQFASIMSRRSPMNLTPISPFLSALSAGISGLGQGLYISNNFRG